MFSAIDLLAHDEYPAPSRLEVIIIEGFFPSVLNQSLKMTFVCHCLVLKEICLASRTTYTIQVQCPLETDEGNYY